MRGKRFRRWVLTDASTVAPLFAESERCGIYVLEFANSERYIGQAKNVVNRYSQHRHGSGQHEPWEDVIAIQFLPVPESELDKVELATIREHSLQAKLRNKAHNHGHWQPTPLDEFIEPSQQRHWATGQPRYSTEDFQSVSNLKGKAPRLLTSKRGLLSVVNAGIGTFIPFSDLEGEFSEDEEVSIVGEIDVHAIEMERSPNAYSVPVDRILMPLGLFGIQALDPEQLAGVRGLAIHAMRRGSARVNSGSRNERLTRLVYKRIAAPDFLADYHT